MANSIPTVLVTSAAWSEPVRINACDFDPEKHQKVTADGKPARRRGRPAKAKETESDADS
jgi:hypothetical protein